MKQPGGAPIIPKPAETTLSPEWYEQNGFIAPAEVESPDQVLSTLAEVESIVLEMASNAEDASLRDEIDFNSALKSVDEYTTYASLLLGAAEAKGWMGKEIPNGEGDWTANHLFELRERIKAARPQA